MSWETNWQQDLNPSDQDTSARWIPGTVDEDDMSLVNVSTLSLDFCLDFFKNKTAELEADGAKFCPVITDGLLCWPPSLLNRTVLVNCFEELAGVKYDSSQYATRECTLQGNWTKVNFANCKEIYPGTEGDTQTTIYFVGYILSLITLTIAQAIFTYFKELRCLRNRIHMNLMWSYMLMYCMWIVTLTMLPTKGGAASIACIFIITLLQYFHIATFFWMFVEGLYLYILVVETLTRENFKLRIYICIGWGLPMVFIVIWSVVKSLISTNRDPGNSCDWIKSHHIDWIFQAPVVLVLLLNLVFLLAIMWVLITKLRSANTVETQQYHKAAKALLVLMPLLGITYVITIYAPTKEEGNVFDCIRAVLLSTQGFMVALFYCFLNTEVQNTMRHHFETWETERSLGPNRLRSGSRSNKDWSPRSRTESIRLYCQPSYKRESCTSDVTTTTLVTVNGGTSNKSTNGKEQTRTISPFLQPPKTNYGGNV